MIEIQLGLAKILEKYKVELSSKTEPQITINPRSFFRTPEKGIILKFSRISDWNDRHNPFTFEPFTLKQNSFTFLRIKKVHKDKHILLL